MSTAQKVIEFDFRDRVVIDGQVVGEHFTNKEKEMLKAVFRHRDVATKEYLLDQLYGGRDEPAMKIVDVFACKIRKKLGPASDAIVSVWGRGYRANPAYTMVRPINTVMVHVDEKLINDLGIVTTESPDAMIDRLLRAERKRLWEL